MAITLNGTTGITTPAVTNEGAYTGDGVVFADGTPSNTLVTTTGGNVGIGTSSPQNNSTFTTLTVDGTNSIIEMRRSGSRTGRFYVDSTGTTIGAYTATPLMFITNDTERMRIDSSGNLLFNSGYGSVATAYGCRAWVNFNGTGTVAIRGSGNVSSITDHGVGDYSINFTTAMPDANYSVGFITNDSSSTNYARLYSSAAPLSSSAFRVQTVNAAQSATVDILTACFQVFR